MCMDISQTSPPERCRQDSSRQGKGARSSVRWMESSGATRAPCTERARRSSARTWRRWRPPNLRITPRSGQTGPWSTTSGFKWTAPLLLAGSYAVSSDGMRMFGVMDLSSGFDGCRFAIGLRNSHDKSFRLSCTVGLRVFVCENLAFHGEYTPVLAKHSKHFSLEDSLAIGVDRMQRNFGPLKQQVEEWRALQLSAAAAKLLIYQAFIEDEAGFPKHLARRVHDLYFQPVHKEFQPRTMWSLSNAFTSAFKELEPIPQYKATAKLAGFLQSVRPQ